MGRAESRERIDWAESGGGRERRADTSWNDILAEDVSERRARA